MNSKKSVTVLVIDDSLAVRKMVDLILSGAGYSAILAASGAEGLRLAREHQPDLILLDYLLPDLRGDAICRQLLDDPATAAIPVVLISANGAAIRQLSTEIGNVKDFLTKPFQSKVLQSTVAGLLTRSPTTKSRFVHPEVGEPAALPATALATGEPAGANGSTPHQVNRVAPEIFPGRAVAPAPAPSRPTDPLTSPYWSGAGQAGSVPGDATAILRSSLNPRFRALARMIPELEGRRGNLPAETYYLPFLLRNELVAEIAAEMGRSQSASGTGETSIAGTSDWMGIDATLLHLGRTSATGVFALRLPEENVDVVLRAGVVVSISSDNPKSYCAGAPFDFRSVPSPAIASAVAAQQRSKVPFFVSLSRSGVLCDPSAVRELLREQGARTLHRALVTPGVRYTFVVRSHPSDLGHFSLGLSTRQAVLEALRFVDDWLEIERVTGSVEKVFGVTAAGSAMLRELQLSAAECDVIDLTDGARPLREVADATGLGFFKTSVVVYCLLKLQIVAVETSVAPVADIGVEDFLRELAPAEDGGVEVATPANH